MIYITGANGWLGLNLVNSIISGKTAKWGLEKDEIQAFILTGTSKEKLLRISRRIKLKSWLQRMLLREVRLMMLVYRRIRWREEV